MIGQVEKFLKVEHNERSCQRANPLTNFRSEGDTQVVSVGYISGYRPGCRQENQQKSSQYGEISTEALKVRDKSLWLRLCVHRPHPNECSGGDLDGDNFFISWDKDLIPCETDPPMDYTGGRSRVTDHDVTLEEIQKFFVDYMINDTLGAISTAHLVQADRDPMKARSAKCLQLAALHSMAVDFAKTGAPAEMPLALRPREFPDFMERVDKTMYISSGVLGKLYRATLNSVNQIRANEPIWSEKIAVASYDNELQVDGFEAFLGTAEIHRDMYEENMSMLMNFYGTKTEDELLTGNMRNKPGYLQYCNNRYRDMKDRILLSVKNVQKEAKEWFESSCQVNEHQKLASAWYHVTYHPTYCRERINFLSFPWIVGDILLNIKSVNSRKVGE
ncbi:RNA-dependent RNA polymerase 2-like [Pistacia vera]|uniref:RNA-dependent RNA polymerase 2-like n=1 Tax=Pistacia vera TaxID=55513 RepID=UPI0012638FD0|nr:RNA-dependent RNA polymerase 2-like [Pistacia vera]